MGVFEMVVLIVLITTLGSLIGKWMHGGRGKAGDDDHGFDDWDWGDWGMGDDRHGKKALKRIDALEERVRVLERIVTDPANKLARDIDELDERK